MVIARSGDIRALYIATIVDCINEIKRTIEKKSTTEYLKMYRDYGPN